MEDSLMPKTQTMEARFRLDRTVQHRVAKYAAKHGLRRSRAYAEAVARGVVVLESTNPKTQREDTDDSNRND
jgi:hypothetical protein